MGWRIHIALDGGTWIETERKELIAEVYRGKDNPARVFAEEIVFAVNTLHRLQETGWDPDVLEELRRTQ